MKLLLEEQTFSTKTQFYGNCDHESNQKSINNNKNQDKIQNNNKLNIITIISNRDSPAPRLTHGGRLA